MAFHGAGFAPAPHVSGFHPGYYPGHYGSTFYYRPYHGGYYHRPYYGYGSGFGLGLALGYGLGYAFDGIPYRSFGGYWPYYYPAGSVLPDGYLGYYPAQAAAALLGVPAVVEPTGIPPIPPDEGTAPTLAPPAPASLGAAPVYLTVRVPDGAQVWVADVASNQAGPVRTFVSPAIEPGVEYVYTVKATWTVDGQPMTRTQRVTVRAGERVTVDLTQPE
jgi:uncharacterized protein (TIGR03000 family)